MKKIFNYLAVMLLLVTGFTACDTEPEENLDLAGYYTYRVAFLPAEIASDYTVTFDGQEVLLGYAGYISRTQPTGKLEVFKKGSTTPEFSQEITKNGNIELVKVGNKPLDIYNADKYITFIPVVLFSGDGTGYTVRFNGIDLLNNVKNYLPKSDLTGTFEIQKTGEASPLFSQEMAIEPGSQLNVMQLAEREFLLIPEDNEPAPESSQYTKVRFFYTADAFPGVNRIKIIMYEWSVFTEEGSVEMNVGELSPYFLIDWDKPINGLYQTIINAETGEILMDGNVNMNASIALVAKAFKFATCRIPVGGMLIPVERGLSTPWE